MSEVGTFPLPLPGELSATWRAISLVGVPAAIALFLVWTLTQSLLTGQREMAQRLDVVSSALVSVQQQHEALKAELAGNRKLFRMICFNTSESKTQQRACLED